MAKRKKKKVFKIPLQVKQIYKTIRGRKFKYVSVTIRTPTKTTNKQFRYRGGKFSTYVSEAKLPKGTKYYVNYKDDRIIKDPSEVQSLIKEVKSLPAKVRKGRKVKPLKSELFKRFHIIPKKTYHPPKPLHADRIVDLLDGKIYYEREHSFRDFPTKSHEDKFLLNVLSKGTKNLSSARKLLQNFNKIRLKLSYSVVIEAVNYETGQTEQIAHFNSIGKKPTEIINELRSYNLTPSEDFVDISSQGINIVQSMKELRGHSAHISGRYKITDVRMAIKFYNSPQTRITRFDK